MVPWAHPSAFTSFKCCKLSPSPRRGCACLVPCSLQHLAGDTESVFRDFMLNSFGTFPRDLQNKSSYSSTWHPLHVLGYLTDLLFSRINNPISRGNSWSDCPRTCSIGVSVPRMCRRSSPKKCYKDWEQRISAEQKGSPVPREPNSPLSTQSVFVSLP